jgi:hypothetical protein
MISSIDMKKSIELAVINPILIWLCNCKLKYDRLKNKKTNLNVRMLVPGSAFAREYQKSVNALVWYEPSKRFQPYIK